MAHSVIVLIPSSTADSAPYGACCGFVVGPAVKVSVIGLQLHGGGEATRDVLDSVLRGIVPRNTSQTQIAGTGPELGFSVERD